MRGTIYSFLCVISFFFFSNTSLASKKEVIEIGGLSFPPFIIKENDSKISGILIDVLNNAISKTGKKAVFRISNWARAYLQIQNKELDAIIPAMKSPDRELFLHYPEQELINFEMSLFARKNKEIFFNGEMSSLKPYLVGRLRNARVSPEFDSARENKIINVDDRSEVELLLKGVAFKRLDLVALDRIVGLWKARQIGVIDQLKVVKPLLGSVPVYIAFSKQKMSADYARKISRILKEMHQAGTIDRIKNQYIRN